MGEVNCSVRVPQAVQEGISSNAFRLVQDSPHEWFLDFLRYTEGGQTAAVVARVRVPEVFLRPLRDRLNDTLGDQALPHLAQLLIDAERTPGVLN